MHERNSSLRMHIRPVTPKGLFKKQNIRRFTPELFNAANDHNPVVAEVCCRCCGQGFWRHYGATPEETYDVSCEDCGAEGAFDEAVPFFLNILPPVEVYPNCVGAVKCPECGTNFPITSNQYWSGLRHECGQKLRLLGEFAHLCWTASISGDSQYPATQ